jgi:4'-phosphopantetheinyl transferase
MRAPQPGIVDLWLGYADSGLTERVLERYLGTVPVLHRGEHGKPALHDGELKFNLSHTGEVAVLAVTVGHDVGVDIERARSWSDPVRFARRFLAPAEACAVAALPARERCEALTRLWTAKEAYVKALGTGLAATPLRSFVIDGLTVTRTHDGTPASEWTLVALSAPPRYRGTLAARGPVTDVRLRGSLC